MEITNTILIVAGVIVTLIGLATFFNPNFARIINAPGGPKIKAMVALIAGVILIIVGLVFQFSG
jgi:hypothetical protein